MIILYKIKINKKKNNIKYNSVDIYNKLKNYISINLQSNILLLLNKINYLEIINKNKFVCKNNFILFQVLNMLSYNKYNNFLIISNDGCFIEPIKFYFSNSKITNIFINNNSNIKDNINKVKKNYIFNEVSLDNLKDDNLFDFIFYESKSEIIINNYDYEKYNKIEKDFIIIVKKEVFKLLKNLNKGGTFYLIIQSFLDESTLLFLQNIRQFFNKAYSTNIVYDFSKIYYFNFIFEDFIGIVEPLPYLSNKFMKSIKRFYKDFFEELEDYKLRYEMIKNNLDNKEYIKLLKIQNLAYSYKFAQDLGFEVYKNIVVDDRDDPKRASVSTDDPKRASVSTDESTYGINIKKNDILLQSLQKMFSFDEGIYVIMRNRDKNLLVNVALTNDIALPEQITYYNKLQNISIRQIDFRPIHLWDETKKFIRYYEHTLNVYLQNYRISIEKTKPVSRAWIKFYELLFVTKVFDNLKGFLKVFHICEAPGTFIMSTIYYLDRWNRDLKYEWDATTLNPRYLSKNGIGDTYDLLKKYKDRWTFGFDGTGDITVEKNIKHYREMCKDRDFIIGDCGLPWGDSAIPGILLYYCQILFILYNLKDGGGCIFKQILNFQHKILVDMIYLLYYCFDIVKVYKPTQNSFSGEFYIVCTGYKRRLKDSDFDILFKVLDDKEYIYKKSIINQEYNKEFIYQFTNALDKIIINFNQTIDKQLFYADFWHLLQHEDKDEIKKYIDIKNKDWVETFLLKKVVK